MVGTQLMLAFIIIPYFLIVLCECFYFTSNYGLICMCLSPTLYSETQRAGIIFVEYINPMWPYPVIVDAQNSVNTCEIKQN